MQPIRNLVGDLISPDVAPPEVSIGATVSDAIAAMRSHPKHAVVVTEEHVVVGIFTERDLLVRVVAGDLDPSATPVAEVMTPDPVTLPPDASISYAINHMGHGGLSNVPIVDAQGKLLALIGVWEVVRHLDEVFVELEAASHVSDPNSPWVDLGGGA